MNREEGGLFLWHEHVGRWRYGQFKAKDFCLRLCAIQNRHSTINNFERQLHVAAVIFVFYIAAEVMNYNKL